MDNKLSKIVGQRINGLLAEKELKQKDLAQYLGVKDNVVSYFCSGLRIPNIEQLKRISEFFNVSADYLLGSSKGRDIDDDMQAVCKYTGLSDTVIKSLFYNKGNTPYNLAHILNSIGVDKNGIIKLSFFISHIVEYEVAAKHYYFLAECSEREKDEQLLESIELQADARKDIIELKEFKLSKEFFEILNVLVKNGDIDNG